MIERAVRSDHGAASGERNRPRVGISACLVGERVRYDGVPLRDRFVCETLARFVEYVPVCPEVELGLGVPRETIRLVRDGASGTRLVAPRSGRDLTAAMRQLAETICRRLDELAVDGFVLKKNSPTCGLYRVRVYKPDGELAGRDGSGVFAQVLRERLPSLPLEEEGRLNDPLLRETFVAQVFGHARLREFFAGAWTLADLVALHAREKVFLHAHDPARARELGRLVARAAELPRQDVELRYRRLHAEALRRPATRGRNVDAMLHLLGHLSDAVDRSDRVELLDAIADYRAGIVPLEVPLALLRHHLRRHGSEWAREQVYLEPFPRDLGLRSRP
jgi:uncharacterized protein YbbK (DUF523 family)/uncharacterized protein YbgA (DUF1722 family)